MVSQRELRRRTIANRRQTALRQRTQQQAVKARQPSAQQRTIQQWVSRINAGEVKDINQIPPEILSKLNVTQAQISQIQSEYKVKREIAQQQKARTEALSKYKEQRLAGEKQMAALDKQILAEEKLGKTGNLWKYQKRELGAALDKLKVKISVTKASKTLGEAGQRLANYEVATREMAGVDKKAKVVYEKRLKAAAPHIANVTQLAPHLQREVLQKYEKRITTQKIAPKMLDPRKETQLVVPNRNEVWERLNFSANKLKETVKKPFNVLNPQLAYVKKGFNWVDDRVHVDLKGTPSGAKLGVSFGLKDKPTAAEKIADTGLAEIDKSKEKLEKTTLGSGNINKLDRELQEKYDKEYQASFERAHKANIEAGKYSSEVAAIAYEVSDDAKYIQSKYQQDYSQRYNQLQVDAGKTGAGKLAGVKMVGLNLATSTIKVARSPTKTLAVGGALAVGGSVLTSIPTAVTYGSSGYFAASGTLKAINPTKTYVERGAGIVTAVASTATLARGGFRYAKGGITRRVTIKAPRRTYKVKGSYGKQTTSITSKGTKSMVNYPSQRSTQIGQAGSRTEVTTRWRAWSNRKLGTKFQPIYKGVPTQQLGKTSYSFGTFGIKTKTMSGYQKASKALKRSGYSQAQIKSTLRYSAPRVSEVRLMKGSYMDVSGSKASGEFGYITKRKVMVVDKKLGIKTRGGGTTFEKINVERSGKITKTTGKGSGEGMVYEDAVRMKFGVTQKNVVNLKQVELTKGIKTVKVKRYEGYVLDKKNSIGGVKVYKQKPISKLDFSQKDYFKLSMTKKKTVMSFNTKAKGMVKDQTIISQKTIDYTKPLTIQKPIGISNTKGGVYRPAKVTKTPWSKTFAPQQKVSFTFKKTLPSTKPTASAGGLQTVTKTKPQAYLTSTPKSKYAGTGMYERTETSGALARDFVRGVPQASKITPIRTSFTTPKVKTRFASVGASSTLSAYALSLKAKQGQATGLQTKTLQAQTPVAKTLTSTSQIQSLSTLTAVVPVTTTVTTTTTITAPVTTTTTTPTQTIKPPVPRPIRPKIPVPITFDEPKKTKKKKPKVKQKQLDVFVRRFGTDRKIGTFSTEARAKKALRKRLAGTLAASGFIERDRKKQKVNLGFAYTTSKKDALRVVQKREFRLGTRSEVGEIGMFKKKKGKKKKKKGGFFL